MKRSIFLAFALVSIQSLAQNNYDGYYYYQGVAGDTAISIGSYNSIYKEHLGDTLNTTLLEVGLYRLMLNPNISIQDDLDIKIMDEQGQDIAATKYDEYIEFFNPSRTTLHFIVETNQVLEDDVNLIGRLFWIYSKTVYKDAPSFELTDIEGNIYTNESLLGKVVVINFWGTQCSPCVREIPQLNKLVRQYAERDDAVFLAISVDTEDRLKEFLERKNFDYCLVLISKSYELEGEFTNVRGFPSQFS